MRTRVVVTGIGAITSIGVGRRALWTGLLEGRSGISEIESFDSSRHAAHRGGEIHARTPVKAVLRDRRGRLRGVRLPGGEDRADAVVLAVPLPRAATLLPRSMAETRDALRQVPFLGVACLAVHLDATVTGSFWCNIHDRADHTHRWYRGHGSHRYQLRRWCGRGRYELRQLPYQRVSQRR